MKVKIFETTIVQEGPGGRQELSEEVNQWLATLAKDNPKTTIFSTHTNFCNYTFGGEEEKTFVITIFYQE